MLTAPADIELDTLTLVQPDLFLTRRIRGSTPRWSDADLLLAIEVLSPSTARFDRVTKRARYQREGIEYWVVDLDSRLVERWLPGEERPEMVTERLQWRSTISPGSCVLDLVAFFKGVLDPASE